MGLLSQPNTENYDDFVTGKETAIRNIATKRSSDTDKKFQCKSVHEGVKYACNLCDYQAKIQTNLTVHIQSIHEGVKYN